MEQSVTLEKKAITDLLKARGVVVPRGATMRVSKSSKEGERLIVSWPIAPSKGGSE